MTGRTGRTWMVPIVLAALTCALFTASQVIRAGRADQVDPGMLVAARQEAMNFFGLDYRQADADVDRVLSLATGKFKDEYAAKRKEVVRSIVAKKLVVAATIPSGGAAVEYVSPTQAQVLVAVDVTTHAAATTAQGPATRYRARLLLSRVHGHWLIAALNQVG